MTLKGLRTGKTYQIGEKVTVVIEEANLREKRVEFAVV